MKRMKNKLYRQMEEKQRELRRCKGQVDRAIMVDLRRSFYSVAELLLSKAGAQMVICIVNKLEDGEQVTAGDLEYYSELVKGSLPVELHRAWSVWWKDRTRHALESDLYRAGELPLKEWGLI